VDPTKPIYHSSDQSASPSARIDRSNPASRTNSPAEEKGFELPVPLTSGSLLLRYGNAAGGEEDAIRSEFLGSLSAFQLGRLAGTGDHKVSCASDLDFWYYTGRPVNLYRKLIV
jgi:hypothetical protein